MDVFELTAKLGLDTSEYDKGLGNAANTGQTFGSKVGGVMKGAGKVIAAGIAAGATAVTAFAKQSIDAGMAFDSSMSNVQAISGATADDMTLLRDKAIEMGAQTKFTAQDSADAFSYMAMAGWKTGDMLDGIGGIMSLAAASGEDLATTSDIVTDALTAFGLEAKDSGHFADVLAAASSNANTNVSMMGETFKYAAPIAGALGFSAEDTAEAIGLMANAGIKGSQAGTSLRTILNSLTGEVKITGKELGTVVVATTNADGTMRDLSDIVDDCRDAFSHLSESEKAQAAEALVGKNAMSGFLALMNASPKDVNKLRGALKNCTYDIDGINKKLKSSGVEWTKYADKAWMASEKGLDGLTQQIVYSLTEVGATAEELQEYLVMEYEMDPSDAMAAIELVQSELENSVGAAQKMSDIMMDNLSGDIELFKSAVGTANIALSDVLTPSLRDFVKFGTEGVGKITTAFQEGGLSGAMSALSDVIKDGLALVLQYIPKIIDAGAQILTALVNGILQNMPLIISAAGQIGNSLIDNIQNILTTNFPALGSAFNGLLETAQTAFNGIITIIQDVFAGDWSAAWNDMMTLVGDVFNGLGDWFLERFNAAKDAITSIDWATVGSNILSFIQNGISGIATWFTDKFTEGKNAIEEIEWANVGQAIWDFIASAFTNIYDAFATLFAPAANGVKFGVDWIQVGTAVLNLIKAAFNAIGTVFTTIFENAKTAIEGVSWLDAGKFILQKIQDAFALIAAWFTVKFTTAADAIKAINWTNVGQAIWDFIANAFANIFNAFKELFEEGKKGVESIDWAALGTSILNLITSAFNAIKSVFGTIFRNAAAAIRSIDWAGLGKAILDFITSAFSAVSTWFTKRFLQVKQAISSIDWAGLGKAIWDWIKEAFAEIATWFKTKFIGVVAAIKEIQWTSLGQAIWDWIKSAFASIATWFKTKFIGVVTAVKEIDWAGLGQSMWNLIKGVFSDIGSWFKKKFEDVLDKIKNISWSDIGSAILNGAKSGIDAIKRKINDLKDAISGLFSGNSRGTPAGAGRYTPYASAMSGGRILASGAEIFGYDNNGPLIGGEAGPEAIVGTGSLDRMIQASVNIAMNRVLDRLDNIIGAMNSGNTQIVLDTGALVGGIAEEMDAELNRIASWKEGGRA